MVGARHYFLEVAGQPVPPRWREAFPAGRALAEPALLDRLGCADPGARLVWLSADEPQWPERLRRLRRAWPGERLVVVSNEPDDTQGLAAIDAGARGYLHASAVPELMQEAALVLEHGGLWVGPGLVQRLMAATRLAISRLPREQPAAAAPTLASLSAREAEVVRAVAAGMSNKEVARLLSITERTVKAHLGAAFVKLGVRDRLQLVLYMSAGA